MAMTVDSSTAADTSPAACAEVLEAGALVTLEELCNACNAQADWIAELVEHGAIEPAGRTRPEWQFASLSIVRVAKAKRLERDLELNLAGVALALELLDEIEKLRSRLEAFETPADAEFEDQGPNAP